MNTAAEVVLNERSNKYLMNPLCYTHEKEFTRSISVSQCRERERERETSKSSIESLVMNWEIDYHENLLL